jgi:hypothetical protein
VHSTMFTGDSTGRIAALTLCPRPNAGNAFMQCWKVRRLALPCSHRQQHRQVAAGCVPWGHVPCMACLEPIQTRPAPPCHATQCTTLGQPALWRHTPRRQAGDTQAARICPRCAGLITRRSSTSAQTWPEEKKEEERAMLRRAPRKLQLADCADHNFEDLQEYRTSTHERSRACRREDGARKWAPSPGSEVGSWTLCHGQEA